jgi:hypothetical protein
VEAPPRGPTLAQTCLPGQDGRPCPAAIGAHRRACPAAAWASCRPNPCRQPSAHLIRLFFRRPGRFNQENRPKTVSKFRSVAAENLAWQQSTESDYHIENQSQIDRSSHHFRGYVSILLDMFDRDELLTYGAETRMQGCRCMLNVRRDGPPHSPQVPPPAIGRREVGGRSCHERS